jgi:Rod binding domain-containing protein
MDMIHHDTSQTLLRAAELREQQARALGTKTLNLENAAQIEEAAKEFEAVFLSEMIKPMFENVKPNALTGGGKGEEIFQGFMVQEYGKIMADRGGIGIAEHVKAELIRLQEDAKQ